MPPIDVVTLVDGILVIFAVEAVVLAWVGRRATRWPPFRALLPNLGAGLCLLLVIRNVAAGGSLFVNAGLLAAAGSCHVADLVVRRRR